MPKKKKIIISESQIKRELSKINLELGKINAKKPEIKVIIPEKQLEPEQEDEEEQENQFHETLETGHASRRFTVPILLPSGQESIDNLEEFAAHAPSPRVDNEKDDKLYGGNKKTYNESSETGSYSGKSDYSLDAKYSASADSLSSARTADRINTSFIREDFTRGRGMNEVQSAGGMQAKTDWEDRSRLEEFARTQADYRIQEEKKTEEKRRRGG